MAPNIIDSATILARFQHAVVSAPHAPGEAPTHEKNEHMIGQLNANATGINSHQGDVQSCHIVLTMGQAAYRASNNEVDFIVPHNPGLLAVIPDDSTALEGRIIRDLFDFERLKYDTYMATDTALKK